MRERERNKEREERERKRKEREESTDTLFRFENNNRLIPPKTKTQYFTCFQSAKLRPGLSRFTSFFRISNAFFSINTPLTPHLIGF